MLGTSTGARFSVVDSVSFDIKLVTILQDCLLFSILDPTSDTDLMPPYFPDVIFMKDCTDVSAFQLSNLLEFSNRSLIQLEVNPAQLSVSLVKWIGIEDVSTLDWAPTATTNPSAL